MRCPSCHNDISDDSTRCSACGAPLQERTDSVVIEPELVEPSPGMRSPRPGISQSTNAHGFSRVFYTTFPSSGVPSGCMPTFITLGLTLLGAVMYGLLAAIGFLVFAAIGRAITFFLTIRHFLEGRIVNPWFFHIMTWAVCWLLVAWLSGNLT